MPHTHPLPIAVTAAALLAVPSLASADGDAGDIAVRIAGGQIETSFVADADMSGSDFDGPVSRVFVADFGEFEGGDDGDIFAPPPGGFSGEEDFITNLPGFDSAPGTFDPGALVGLDVVTGGTFFGDNLVRYDPPSDSVVSTGADLQINFGNDLRRTDGSFGSDPLYLPAFSGGEQDAGRWHRHYPFAVYDGLGADGDLTAPGAGVYILEAELATLQPGVGSSDPLFIVFGVNSPEADVDAAVDFVTAAIPEPTGLSLLGVAGLALVRRRR